MGVKRRLPEGTTALGQPLYNNTCSVFSCLNYLTSGSSSSTTLRINYTRRVRVFSNRSLLRVPDFSFHGMERERERGEGISSLTREHEHD